MISNTELMHNEHNALSVLLPLLLLLRYTENRAYAYRCDHTHCGEYYSLAFTDEVAVSNIRDVEIRHTVLRRL